MKPAVAATAAVLMVVLLVSVALLVNNMLAVKSNEPQLPPKQVRLHTDGSYTFPVDVVVTWCQETPERAATRRHYDGTQRNKTHEGGDRRAPLCTTDCEVHYAVKSVQRFMPWVRTIYVLTPRPQDPHIPGTVLVFNEQLCDDPAVVPTFNSHVVESFMHRIPHLAEQFIYFNDDTMVGQPLSKSTFFTEEGFPILYSEGPYTPALILTDGYRHAWYNLTRLVKTQFNTSTYQQIHHATALSKRACYEAERAFAPLYAKVRTTRFRDKTNVPPVGLALNNGLIQGTVARRHPAKEGLRYFSIYRKLTPRRLKRLKAAQPHLLCLNYVPDEQAWSIVRPYLNELFQHQHAVLPPALTASTVVPKRIWQTWHTKELPPKMAATAQKMIHAHPDFHYVFMDDNECALFIDSNFAGNVSHAFQDLIPGAFKADLWRLCVLYKYGGVYLDIKFAPVHAQVLQSLLGGNHFVRDKIRGNVTGIYNGFMVCVPGDPRLLQCIHQIVEHVQLRYYGKNSLTITGPHVLHKFIDPSGEDVDLLYNSKSTTHRFIQDNSTRQKLLVSYPAYNAEQKRTQAAPYYEQLWKENKVYAFGQLPSGLHLNFLEIGTSDFNTCIQDATHGTWGMSVEAVASYLKRLPDKPGVRKVHQAVSDRSGTIDIHYIPPETIQQLQLPKWVRGCNSVNKVHPKVLRELQTRKIANPESYFATDTVRVTDMETLLKEQNVATFEYLKLDTEGHDCVILQSLLDACQRNRAWFPRKIVFETNILTPKEDVDKTCALFQQQGYRVKRGTPDSLMFRQW